MKPRPRSTATRGHLPPKPTLAIERVEGSLAAFMHTHETPAPFLTGLALAEEEIAATKAFVKKFKKRVGNLKRNKPV